ncbi:hypothetical protein K9N68_10230 [Kovacikia minuta CCNUW1]|uniref:hypothetical protein n=1 Tax=Kovacikia minuta TaxID=2931930 RepID=UPI001CCF387E|nr:hypothetical protein [Kovacikia minuta]UBF28218.1 hypothetical protein K9N68_10230 [Kovacikia minuta CCNUW1]
MNVRFLWTGIAQCSRFVSIFMLSITSLILLSLPVLAETKQIRSVITPTKEQTYLQMMRQAESLATRLVDRAFAENATITSVSVVILGERNGQEIPLLSSTVSRDNWKRISRIQPWSKYFGNSSIALMGFTKLPQPKAAPPPVPLSAAPMPETPSPKPPSSPALQPLAPETASNSPSTSPPTPSIKPPSINPGLSPSRIRIEDDPAYRDD